MKNILFKYLLTATLLWPALGQAASPVQPEVGAPACFKRVYSQDHMRQHPKQKLSSLYVEVRQQILKSEGESYPEIVAKLVGVSDGKYYLNDGAGCSYQKDGSTHCGVDCDGGAFDLTPYKSNVFFTVAKDYYFPLFKNGTDQDTAGEGDSISLDWSDRENRAYLLQQVPAAECRAAQKRARIGQWGC